MDPIVKLTGPNNSYVYVTEVNGRYYQAHPEFHGNVENVHSSLKARPDDIICSFPKSGLQWLWEIVTMFRRKSADLVTHLPEASILDMRPLEAIEHLPSPGVLATHCRPELLPASVRESGTRIICLFCDPRAVTVSGFHHLSKLSGPDKFRFIQENKERHKIHVVYYEDVKKDPLNEIKRLNENLGYPFDMNLVKEIAEKTTFEQLKASKEPLATKKNKMFASGKYEIYRKGETDNWKDYYTVKDNEELIELFNSRLKGKEFKLKSSL